MSTKTIRIVLGEEDYQRFRAMKAEKESVLKLKLSDSAFVLSIIRWASSAKCE